MADSTLKPNADAGQVALPPGIWYFLLPGVTFYFHALAIDDLYRTFLYANLVVVLVWTYRLRQRGVDIPIRRAALIALPTAGLILLFVLSDGEIRLKEVRHLIAYTFIALGCLMIPTPERMPGAQKKWLYLFATAFVVSYTLIQASAVFVFDQLYGTTTNPHYLAQYSLLLIIMGFFLIGQSSARGKLLLAGAIVLLGSVLIHTGSRTAWLSLLITMVFYFLLNRRHLSWKVPTVAATIVLSIYLLNIGGLADRADNLIENITTEERVYIWQDTWRAQQASSVRQWLFGHGVNSFKADFRNYSRYHYAKGRHFSSPHNHLLHVLYTAGVAGVVIVAGVLFFIYRSLLAMYREQNHPPHIGALLALLTANLIVGSITIGFFTSYNLLILSMIGGLAMSLRYQAGAKSNRPGTSP